MEMIATAGTTSRCSRESGASLSHSEVCAKKRKPGSLRTHRLYFDTFRRPAEHGCCSGGKWDGRSPGTQVLSMLPSLRQSRRDWRRPFHFPPEQHPCSADGLEQTRPCPTDGFRYVPYMPIVALS